MLTQIRAFDDKGGEKRNRNELPHLRTMQLCGRHWCLGGRKTFRQFTYGRQCRNDILFDDRFLRIAICLQIINKLVLKPPPDPMILLTIITWLSRTLARSPPVGFDCLTLTCSAAAGIISTCTSSPSVSMIRFSKTISASLNLCLAPICSICRSRTAGSISSIVSSIWNAFTCVSNSLNESCVVSSLSICCSSCSPLPVACSSCSFGFRSSADSIAIALSWRSLSNKFCVIWIASVVAVTTLTSPPFVSVSIFLSITSTSSLSPDLVVVVDVVVVMIVVVPPSTIVSSLLNCMSAILNLRGLRFKCTDFNTVGDIGGLRVSFVCSKIFRLNCWMADVVLFVAGAVIAVVPCPLWLILWLSLYSPTGLRDNLIMPWRKIFVSRLLKS